jgi:leucyl aminopeptidase (aminopeptidase T)
MHMRVTYSIGIFFVLLLALSCQKKAEQQETVVETAPFSFDWDAMSTMLMRRMNLERGEKVLLVASPGRFDALVPLLKEKIQAAGGEYLGAISVDSANFPEDWKTAFVTSISKLPVADMSEELKQVDIAIMLPGADVSHPPYIAMQNVLRGGRGRTIHFHWSGAYSLNGSPLAADESIDEQYQTALLKTDYRQLSGYHQNFEEAARSNEIHVTTPSGTDIRFSLGDRPVTKQDGDASKGRTAYAKNLIDREIELPAGAIRLAPIEESVNGKIRFPDGEWSGKEVTGLVLTFKSGKISGMTATSGLDAVKEELAAAGPAGYWFREFALGFNPLLAIPQMGPRWIPYYGYGAGVVRLSLGDNTELGGKVKGGYVRWNFFTDASVTVGNKPLVKDGQMLP